MQSHTEYWENFGATIKGMLDHLLCISLILIPGCLQARFVVMAHRLTAQKGWQQAFMHGKIGINRMSIYYLSPLFIHLCFLHTARGEVVPGLQLIVAECYPGTKTHFRVSSSQ